MLQKKIFALKSWCKLFSQDVEATKYININGIALCRNINQ
jgi:hypothetical protein